MLLLCIDGETEKAIVMFEACILKKKLALKVAEEERMYRGGNKYYPEVIESKPNFPKSSEDDREFKTVLELRNCYRQHKPQ